MSWHKVTWLLVLLLKSTHVVTIEIGRQLVVARDWREGRMRCDYLMGMRFPFGVTKMFATK